jgi:transposase-like protein
VSEGAKEDKASWTQFLRELKERGLKGVQLIVSDKCLGLVENLAEFYPEAKWQRCVVHFYRNVWTAVPSGKVKGVAAMLKAIHAQEDAQAAREKAPCGGEATRDAIGASCRDRRSEHRRNSELLRNAGRTLALSSHQ